MTDPAHLHDRLLAAFKGYTFSPSDPLSELLPEVCDALKELHEIKSGPQFIAIPRVSRHGLEVKRDGE